MRILPLKIRNRLVGMFALLFSASATLIQAAPDAPCFVIDASRGYLLGASQGGKWLNDKAARKLLRGGEKYTIFDGNRVIGTANGGKAESQGAPCEDTYFVKLSGKEPLSGIALSGPTNKTLRRVKVLNPAQAIYRAEVAKWLRAHGLKNPIVNIVKIWRADLDGDGTDEVLISAVRQDGKAGPVQNVSPDAKSGDYSVLLLRRVTKKGVQNIEMDSKIYPKSKTFSAPSIHELVSLLDLNGDGRLEIVLRGRYYEGDWTSVYEYRNGAVKEVIGAGCGA